ncbi:hypothetical protein RHSIM_Rhsim10G0153300 [Rhododendron simsii]|uniref:Uncharacterized protein n=1 Tax=Rhododendron simsii TaxID=118357 RepID=A0A834LCL0_RHOSS|nr:hypothetical protein RHSIM_Rhsim10G0153300 [Rhododendron simsii]
MTASQKPMVQTATSSNPSTSTPTSLESELDLDQQPSREGVHRPSGIKAALESRRKKVIDDVKFDQMAANQSLIINVLTGISSRGIEREQQKAVDRQKKAGDREARRHYLVEKNEREQRKEDHIIMSGGDRMGQVWCLSLLKSTAQSTSKALEGAELPPLPIVHDSMEVDLDGLEVNSMTDAE